MQNGIQAVAGVGFSQQQGERIAIAGEAGSGKSSVLKMIAGLMQPDAGEVQFMDKRVRGPEEVLIPGHKKIAYLSQHFELRNNYHVYEVLDIARKIEAHAAARIFTICRIEHLLQRRTNELSGGEKQRIALARLLCAAPKLLLLDEPFSNLDASNQLMIQQVLNDMQEALQMTCLMVSHDAGDMLAWADKIIIMKEGTVVQTGNPQEIYFTPADAYCAGLFGAYNQIDSSEPAFAFLQQHYPGQELVFLRPVQLQVCPIKDAQAFGRISRVAFRGSHSILHVQAEGHELLVQTNRNDLPEGIDVGIKLR